MATGGTPLARVLVLLVLFAIPALTLTIDHGAYAQDSEASVHLKNGLEKLRAGENAEAVKLLRQALAADPSSEEVLGALGRAEYAALMSMLAAGGDAGLVAEALLSRAQPVLPDKAFNEEELKRLVKSAVTSENYAERFDSAMSLARTYGEFAVPHLVAYLGSSNTDYKVNAHITLMSRLSREAVLPLNEAMTADNADIRRMVAVQLGTICDMRSLPALAEAAGGDADPDVVARSSEALAKLIEKFPDAAGLGASDLYLNLARFYYAGDYRVMSFANRPMVLWFWQDGLKNQPAPRHLYILKLAEESAYDALRVDPNNMGARALLARILASQKIASDAIAPMMEGDELTETYAKGLENARGTVAALGWESIRQALTDSLDSNDQAAAAFLLDTMPAIYSSSDFTGDSAAVRATTDSNASVRLAAAEALLRFNSNRGITSFPDPDGFISLVARSVGEIVPRNILVIDGNDERRNKLLTEINDAMYIGYDARSGTEGVVRAYRYIGLDLIVLSAELVDMEPLQVLAKLSENDRTKDVPVVLVGTPEQAGNQEWSTLFEEKVAAIAAIPTGPGLPSKEFRKTIGNSFGERDLDATARYGRSASMLDAIATTDTNNALFNWNALTETLVALVKAPELPNDPPVRLNALRALANIGDPASMEALVAYFGSDADAALRAAAGNAIAAVARKGQISLDEGAFKALLAGTGDADGNVRKAAFAALGSAALTPEQSLAVATANRPGAGG